MWGIRVTVGREGAMGAGVIISGHFQGTRRVAAPSWVGHPARVSRPHTPMFTLAYSLP